MSPTFATQKSGGAGVDPIPEGTHVARIYQFIHLGTVPGFEGRPQDKCRLTFELPNELHTFKEEEGPKPRVISQSFTLSTSEKATLRKVIEAAIGTALTEDEADTFDAEKLVGLPLLISIKHKTKSDGGGKFAVISSYAPMMKGVNVPPQVNPSKVLNYGDSWDKAFFESLPDFLKDEMKKSPQYHDALVKAGEVPDMDIPF